MPLHGDGEQSTKSGGPCPNWPQPPAFCTLENDLPPFVLAPLDGPLLPLPDPPLLEPEPLDPLPPEPPLALVELSATEICSGFCFEFPFASRAETVKLKLPALLGVPEIVPAFSSSPTPSGNLPVTTANV